MAEQGLIARASPGERETYLSELRLAAENAERAAGGLQRRDFRIAGLTVSIRAAGEEMMGALTDAFAHALVEPDAGGPPPDLTVRAWDRASTGVTLPPPSWGSGDFRGAGAVRAFSTDGLHVLFQEFSNTVSVLDPDAGEGMFWCAAAELPFYERAAPLCKLLHLWLSERGLQLAHAAAVAGESGCALIAGPAGAGKSSTALACLGAPGLKHLADDYCVVERGPDGVVIHPLFSSVKATDDTVERLRIDPETISNPVRIETDKALVFLGLHRPGDLAQVAPLRAIVVPEITGEPESRLLLADGALALAALAPSTMLQLPGTGAATMAALAAAARSVPCHRLEAGTDPAAVPPLISELLA